MATTPILCRSCGGGLDEGSLGEELRCPKCGSSAPLDDALRAQLRRHAARVRRADQKIRAVLRRQVHAELMPEAARRMRRTRLTVFTAGPAVAVVVGLCAIPILGYGLYLPGGSDLSGLMMALGSVFCIGAFLLLVGGLVLAAYLHHRLRVKLLRSMFDRSLARMADWETTAPVRCGGCGAPSAVVVVGDAPAVPCPWCGVTLLPEVGEDHAASVGEVVRRLQAEADGTWADAVREVTGEAPERYEDRIDGFVTRGGIFEAEIEGLPAWVAGDVTEVGVLQRVEIETDTAQRGTTWFVRKLARPRIGAAAALLERPLPAQQLDWEGPLARTVDVLTTDPDSARQALDGPELQQLLQALDVYEAVCLDGAGGSCWSVLPMDKLYGSKNLNVFGPPRATALARVLAAQAPGAIIQQAT